MSAGFATVSAYADETEWVFRILVSAEPLSILPYQSDTTGDRLKIDINNFSLYQELTGNLFVALFDSQGRLLETNSRGLSLAPSSGKTVFVPISQLENGNYFKFFVFNDSEKISPMQTALKSTLLTP